MLRDIEASPFECTALLYKFQKTLSVKIKRTEIKIVALREQRRELSKIKGKNRLSKQDANRLRNKIRQLDEAIGAHKHLLFIWRAYGDAIAFIYIDTWAMKHMFYSTEDYSVKQTAGAMSGNTGAAKEWAVLRAILKKGIPCVLSDLTNTIRFGDVCILVGPDPFPIEIKSSQNINARTARQAANLKELQDFLTKDHAVRFRGLDDVARREMRTPSFNLEPLNECIEQSRSQGFALISPEPGLNYLCIRSALPPLELLNLGSRHFVGNLSEALASAAWMPYRPFTLSIFSPKNVADFILGEFLLFVFVDAKIIETKLLAEGLATTLVDDHQLFATLTRIGSKEPNWSAITRHVFTRVFLEFASLSGILEMAANCHTEFEAMQPSHITQEEADALVSSGKVAYKNPVFKPLFRD